MTSVAVEMVSVVDFISGKPHVIGAPTVTGQLIPRDIIPLSLILSITLSTRTESWYQYQSEKLISGLKGLLLVIPCLEGGSPVIILVWDGYVNDGKTLDTLSQ